MAEKQRIVIVEDHTLLRAGLEALLRREADIEIVSGPADGRDALKAIGGAFPDLVLIDLSMPRANGIEAIAEIKRRYPETRVLVMTIYKTDEHLHESLRAGADGYILKDASQDELRIAIRSVLNGKTYLSPDISSKVIDGYLGGGRSGGSTSPWESLTYREREVLKRIAEGHTNRHIADDLSLSIKTVEKHRSNLMKKLDLHNASSLTAYAIERGLVGT